MGFRDPDLENVAQLVSKLDEGQLYGAIHYLLRDEDGWAKICSDNSLTAANSRNKDANRLKNWFWKYDIYSWSWFRRVTGAHEVVNGALMFIGNVAYKLPEGRLLEALRVAQLDRAGRLYWTLRSLLREKPETTDAICNQSWLQLTGDDDFSHEQETIRTEFGFTISKRTPRTFVLAALLLLGFHYYKNAKSQRAERRTGDSSGHFAEESGLFRPEPVPRQSPATALAMVLRASKFSEFPADGAMLATEVAERWLLDATFYTCLQPAQADDLEQRLGLLGRPELGGEEDVYVRLLMPPGSGFVGKITKFGLLQALRTAGSRELQVVKLGRLDTGTAGGAMSEFQMS